MQSFCTCEDPYEDLDPLLVIHPDTDNVESQNSNEGRQCRICLEEEENESGLLIAPCSCKGSQQWVHRKCLEEWRANNTDHIAFSKCMACMTDYHTVDMEQPQHCCYLSSARDVGIGCALLQSVLLLLGALIWFYFAKNDYSQGQKTMAGVTINDNWGQVLLADLVTGILFVLMLLALYGMVLLHLWPLQLMWRLIYPQRASP